MARNAKGKGCLHGASRSQSLKNVALSPLLWECHCPKSINGPLSLKGRWSKKKNTEKTVIVSTWKDIMLGQKGTVILPLQNRRSTTLKGASVPEDANQMLAWPPFLSAHKTNSSAPPLTWWIWKGSAGTSSSLRFLWCSHQTQVGSRNCQHTGIHFYFLGT